jgi:hypothetical protein
VGPKNINRLTHRLTDNIRKFGTRLGLVLQAQTDVFRGKVTLTEESS